MATPDAERIAEAVLTAEGFIHGRSLAAKLVTLFDLARHLLSPQKHYDW